MRAAEEIVRVDHVGSLLRPPELLQAMQAIEKEGFPADRLKEIQDRHIRDVVKLQESLGLERITDGEFRRRGWSRGFMDAIEGFSIRKSYFTFRNDQGATNPAPGSYVDRKIKRSRPIVADDYRFIEPLTRRTPKVTMPSPSILHFGLFDESVDHAVYPTIDAFFTDLITIYRAEIADLASAGCRFLQLDETQLAVFCDAENQSIARKYGKDPDQLLDLYVDLNNRLLAERPADMTVGMHLCRGNQAGLYLGSGGYDPVADRLFNKLDVDIYFLEYDSARAGGFEPLRYVPKGKIVMLGLVSTKDPRIEPVEEIRRRVDEAAKYIPIEQLGICPQCGFASSISTWNVTTNPMTPDVQKQKLSRLVEAAAAIWS